MDITPGSPVSSKGTGDQVEDCHELRRRGRAILYGYTVYSRQTWQTSVCIHEQSPVSVERIQPWQRWQQPLLGEAAATDSSRRERAPACKTTALPAVHRKCRRQLNCAHHQPPRRRKLAPLSAASGPIEAVAGQALCASKIAAHQCALPKLLDTFDAVPRAPSDEASKSDRIPESPANKSQPWFQPGDAEKIMSHIATQPPNDSISTNILRLS